MFKDEHLGEKMTNLAENIFKVELRGVHGVRFFQVCPNFFFALGEGLQNTHLFSPIISQFVLFSYLSNVSKSSKSLKSLSSLVKRQLYEQCRILLE